jgi:hypothetical protein
MVTEKRPQPDRMTGAKLGNRELGANPLTSLFQVECAAPVK